MEIEKGLEKEVQVIYENDGQKHLQYILSSLLKDDHNGDITLVGLADGFMSILAKQADLGTLSDKDNELCDIVLNAVHEQDDKLRALILVSKIATEALCKSIIAREIKEVK